MAKIVATVDPLKYVRWGKDVSDILYKNRDKGLRPFSKVKPNCGHADCVIYLLLFATDEEWYRPSILILDSVCQKLKEIVELQTACGSNFLDLIINI